MNPEEVFEANLSLIERVIARVCRKAHLSGADAEDFSSAAKLFLIDRDHAVLRQHDPSSSLDVYLAVVLHRFLIDERNRERGRWRSSAEAKRMGIAGVLLEKLLRRDGRPMSEVVPIVRAADGTLTEERIEEMVARLPERAPRPRPIPLDDAISAVLTSRDDAATRIVESDRRHMAERAGAVIRDAVDRMTVEDRMLMKLHYGSAMNISDIARMLGLPQRPLYRRVEALLAQLRKALTDAGVDAATAFDLGEDLDFGIRNGKTSIEGPSLRNGSGGG